jgi:nucleoside-diphosphate-sugar epimerase
MHLIVGGSGFLGTHLARHLVGLGEAVRIFDLQHSPLVPADVEVIHGDVLDVKALCQAARDAQTVFHLAGLMAPSHAPSELMHGVNVGGTANAIRAALEAGVRRFVFISSAEVYGYPSHMPIAEDDPKQPVSLYGRYELEAEECCQRAWREERLECVCLRLSTLVGPGMTDRFLLLLLASMARNQPIAYVGSGRNRCQMTAVEDCAVACWLAATVEGIGGEAFNIGSAHPLGFVEQAEAVRAQTGTRCPLWRVPQEPAATVIRWLGRLHLVPLQPEHIPLLYRDFVMDISKAEQRLGWRPQLTNVDMIVRAYQWYIEGRRQQATKASDARASVPRTSS